MRFAARKADMLHQQMLNENAAIIQNSYRAHLWDKLLLAATLNNRARRIQRGFRAYQYRFWASVFVARRRIRKCSIIQKFIRHSMWKILLVKRFKMRKVLLIFERGKMQLGAARIQRCYRIHVEWVKYVKEQLRLYYASLRANKGLAISACSVIQRNWRKFLDINKFPHHVLMLCRRLHAEARRKLRNAARKIQMVIRACLVKTRALRLKRRTVYANRLV